MLSRSGQAIAVSALSVLFLFAVLAVTAAPQSAADVRKQLAGHYRLLKFENFDEKGVARPSGYEAGRILYDEAGQMSAHLMRGGRKPLSSPSTEAERAAAYSGYLAYYGAYTLDPATKKVTHHVEGSTNPNWVKTDLIRYYEFSPDGNRLMLSLKNAEGRITGTLTWERIR